MPILPDIYFFGYNFFSIYVFKVNQLHDTMTFITSMKLSNRYYAAAYTISTRSDVLGPGIAVTKFKLRQQACSKQPM